MILLYTWQLLTGLTCAYLFGLWHGYGRGKDRAEEERDKKWDAGHAEKFKAWQNKETQP